MLVFIIIIEASICTWKSSGVNRTLLNSLLLLLLTCITLYLHYIYRDKPVDQIYIRDLSVSDMFTKTQRR